MSEPDRLGVVVVKPDGVAQARTAAVVSFLGRRGFRLVACRELVLTPARRAALYRTTRTVGRLDWDLNAILYKLGPVHALLVDGPAGPGFDSAAHRLSAGLKGSFIPARATAGTIRGELGALNPVFNLVHATDATADLEREAAALFDRPIRELTTAGAGGAGPPPGAAGGGQFPLWSTVAATLRGWLARRAGAAAVEALGAVRWPADSAGPRRPALRSAVQSWDRLLAAVRPRVDQGSYELLAGIRTGASSYRDFAAAGTTPAWPTYLTYTTVRYLDLCLELSDAG
jgi:nucleoside diphosphate kinase